MSVDESVEMEETEVASAELFVGHSVQNAASVKLKDMAIKIDIKQILHLLRVTAKFTFKDCLKRCYSDEI